MAIGADADPGPVHQARIADRYDGDRTASQGERAQPENDGHGTRLPSSVGLL